MSGALDVLTNYVGILRDCPQYFAAISASEAADIGAQDAHSVLPHRDRHGRRVMLYRAGRWDPERFTFSQCFRLGYMLSELVALEPRTQVAGVTTIADASGFGFAQFRGFTIDDCRNAARFVQVTHAILPS